MLAAWLLLLPAAVMVLGVLAYPVAWEAWVSLTNLSPSLDGPARFVGLANYARLLTDPAYRFWPAATTLQAARLNSHWTPGDWMKVSRGTVNVSMSTSRL